MIRGSGLRAADRLRVCVCTSYPACREPRAPRHAATLARIPNVDVVLLDCSPSGEMRYPSPYVPVEGNIQWQTHAVPHRGGQVGKLILGRFAKILGRTLFQFSGIPSSIAVNSAMWGFANRIAACKADVIMAHNIDTLLPAWLVASRTGALLVFDSMEFHSQMGEGQDKVERQLVERIESRCLPKCQLITASSERIADALESRYGVKDVLALYNTPPRADLRLREKVAGFSLYWRNSTIGLGQRGLGDAIQALAHLPDDVTLHIQGRAPMDGGLAIRDLAKRCGVEGRLVVHGPFEPQNAIEEATKYHVGLCLEHKGVLNHELTVSNKLFDYHMAGLAVVASDLPPLRDVLSKSNGGVMFEPGNPDSLVKAVMTLYESPKNYTYRCKAARAYAVECGNLETEMEKFVLRFLRICRSSSR